MALFLCNRSFVRRSCVVAHGVRQITSPRTARSWRFPALWAASPRAILQALAETILNVTRSDSAGVSLLTTDDGGKRFYWPAIAGLWKPHIGGGTPRNFGPCGDVLDCNTPLMFTHFERRYTYFLPVTPLVEAREDYSVSRTGKEVSMT